MSQNEEKLLESNADVPLENISKLTQQSFLLPQDWESNDVKNFVKDIGLNSYIEDFSFVSGKDLLKLNSRKIKNQFPHMETSYQQKLLRNIRALQFSTPEPLIGIVMKTFKKGDGSLVEEDFNELVKLITRAFQDENFHLASKYKITKPYKLNIVGNVDEDHSFIRIFGSDDKLEKIAEHERWEVQKKIEDFSEEKDFSFLWNLLFGFCCGKAVLHENQMAVLYEPFNLHNRDTFALPGEDLRTQQEKDLAPSISVLPQSHKLELMRKKLEEIMDEFLRDRKTRVENYLNNHPEVNEQEHTECEKFLRHAKMGFQFGSGIRTATDLEIIVEVFPMHCRAPGFSIGVDEFLRRYCSWRTLWFSCWAFSRRSNMFIEYIRNYLGEKIAMYFAFLHYYTTALLPIAIFGLILASFMWSKQEVDNAFVPIYCMYASLWAIFFLEFWKRNQNVYAYRWNMADYDTHEKTFWENIPEDQQEEFGFYEKEGSWVSLNKYVTMNPHYKKFVPRNHRDPFPPNWRNIQQFVTFTCLSTLTIGMIVAALGLLVFKVIVQRAYSTWGSIAGGSLNGIMISLLDLMYTQIAIKLNNWEGHRTSSVYENALIRKLFFFQFINSYISLFYIAFVKSQSIAIFGTVDNVCIDWSGNPVDQCITELQIQLSSIFLVRLIFQNTVEIAIPYIGENLKVFCGRKDEVQETQTKFKKATSIEKQFFLQSYSQLRIYGTFWDYNELAIQYGYIILFAPAFPLAPFLSIILNICENIVDVRKIISHLRRPWWQGTSDIGSWEAVFRFISVCAVITNSLMICLTSSVFNNWYKNFSGNEPDLGNKLLFIFFIEHILLGIHFVISLAIPDSPGWLRVETNRMRAITEIENQGRRRTEFLTNWLYSYWTKNDSIDLFDEWKKLYLKDINENKKTITMGWIREFLCDPINYENTEKCYYTMKSSYNNNNNNDDDNEDYEGSFYEEEEEEKKKNNSK